jgi:hypothetical protein
MRYAQAASAVCIRLTLLDVLVEPPAPACAPLRPPRLRPARGDLAGRRLRRPGQHRVYLVDPAGYRRRVPDQAVYNRIFRDWRGIDEGLDPDDVPSRPPFTSATMLVRGDASSAVFLLDQGRKRLVPSSASMSKYWFDSERVHIVRQVLMDHFPVGHDCE